MSSSTTRGRRKSLPAVSEAFLTESRPGQMSPLAYLLVRINDPMVPAETRDKLAIAACPFCHPRAGYGVGKKAAAAAASKDAGRGSAWGDDLVWTDGRRPQ